MVIDEKIVDKSDICMLSQRQIKILETIIREYIKRAEPIGSEESLWKKLDVSSATIRNEMKELEDAGFLSQPHTSAGRAPTLKGYKYFIDNLMKECALNAEERKVLGRKNHGVDFEEGTKQQAKALAQLTFEAVILTFGKDNFYYTGLTNIFSKPEFRESGNIISLSEVLDELDEAVQKLFNEELLSAKILIGSKSPFGASCGVIAGLYKKNGKEGILAVFGPIRMDYERNISLLNCVLDALN